MASYIDLGSSPDPLGDDDDMELPSVMRPPSRRVTKTISTGRTSILSVPESGSRFTSSRKSPRRQTFELDVGDERLPQRLIVTVEADDVTAPVTHRSITNRRLFPPSSSPSRSRSRRRETTTTTTVPLRGLTDDEGGELGSELNTLRKRGRPLGCKNGTPAPRGKKRAGTPLQRSPGKTRQRNKPESEISMFSSDAQLDMGTDGLHTDDDPTPKPKPKAKKNTPANRAGSTPAAVPSSKPTGRKRGRPRKALMPNEVATLTSEADNREINSDLLLTSEMDVIPEANAESHARHDLAPSTSPPRDAATTHSPPPDRDLVSDDRQEADLIDQMIDEGPEEEPDTNMSYGAMREVESDDESEAAAESEANYGRQDTLAHASDFSMIAVESLPSFQASFQASQNGASRFGESQPPRFAEGGEETNFMINKSLRSLRNSAQGGQPHEQEEHARHGKSQLPSDKPSSSAHADSSPSNYVMSSPQTWSKSPKRMRQTPLSRQVFAKKAAPVADDSFSSLPESVLRAATPGKPSVKATNTENTMMEDADLHEDSFSELPDEVLQDATPGPSTRAARHSDGPDNPSSQLFSADIHSTARSTNAFRSARLPTPDATNSSTTGSKNAHEDESRNVAGEPSTAAINTSDLNIHSSPPRIGVQHADEVDMEPGQSEANAVDTPSPHNSSPSPQYPHAKLGSPGLGELLEPPMSTRRPTLSPIVRVGRTLQNVMSDKSSPEGRGSSLGSPFRRSGSDSRQSSVQKSPINEKGESANDTTSKSLFNPIASFAQSIRSNFSQISHRAPSPSVTGRGEDAFGLNKPQLPSAADPSVVSAPRRHSLQAAAQPEQFPTLESSTRTAAPSEAYPDWGGEDSSPSAQRIRRISAPPRSFGSMNSSSFDTLVSNGSRAMEVEENVTKKEEIEDEALQGDSHGDVHYEDDQQFSESEQEQFQGENDTAYDEDSDPEPVDEKEEQGVTNDQLHSQTHDDERGQEQPAEDEDLEHESIERDVPEDGRADDSMDSHHDLDGSLEPQPNFDEGDDGMDMWDIEAARPTPKPTKVLRNESRARRQSLVDVIARPSHSRENSLLNASTNGEPSRRSKIPSPWKRNIPRLIYQDDFKSPAHIEMDDSPSEGFEEEFSLIAQLATQDKAHRPQEDVRPEPRAMPHVSYREDTQQEIPESPQEEAPVPMEDITPEQTEPLPAPKPAKEPEDYSLLAKPKQDVDKAPEKPARRSGIFGAFDIMSFFSSPAPLPTTNTPAPKGAAAAPETVSRPNPKPYSQTQALSSAEKSHPEEPRSALRAAGLFPPIPQKASFRRSPERQIDLFSPGTALRSGDTIPDTYAETPSTPERQSFPHIPQKQNFTPLSGRSRNTASLFTPSVAPSTAEEDRMAEDDAPEPEEENYYLREQESDDNDDDLVRHEDSIMTVESEYERVPPREKPSLWDKNASPTKSCLRSPLKPKTPGRVVEFVGNAVRASEQVQAWMGRQALGIAGMGGNNLGQDPQFVGYEEPDDEEPTDKENGPSPPKDNYFPAHFAGSQRAMSPAKPAAESVRMPPTANFRVPNGQNAAAEAKPPIILQPFSRTTTGNGAATAAATAEESSMTWLKSHWIHLDELLQLRRHDPARFRERQARSSSQSSSHESSSPPASAALLGKEVSAQGERIILEPWHLEIVDAFRHEADPGRRWDDKSLAKRLFALIVGEERRRRGIDVVPGPGKKPDAGAGAGTGARRGKKVGGT